MDLSLATLPNMLSNLTFKNLPSLSHFGHEQKNAKIASESSLLVTYQCSYCDGRENHPRRGFSTEATASYSHWRGLSELMSKEQVLSAVVCFMLGQKFNVRLAYLCQSDRKIVLRRSLHSAQKSAATTRA